MSKSRLYREAVMAGKDPMKVRNPVAKNSRKSGKAGPHKDKKKDPVVRDRNHIPWECAGCGFAHPDDYKDCVWNKDIG